MSFKARMEKWRTYSEMSDLGIIARRKFFNNCFDGALTCAGIVSGAFMLFIFNTSDNTPADIIVLGFATALAIGISGLWGAFLSEEAERKKKMTDLKKDMVIIKDLDNHQELLDHLELEKKEIEKAMVIPIKSSKKKNDYLISFDKKVNNNKKSLVQQAENFATIVASLVDGGAPVLGSSLPLIPFFFGITLTYTHFIFSYIILLGLLIYLGIYLGKISGGGGIKYAIHLVTAGIVTLLVSLLLGV
jgi:predicted membrane protein (TIGR00267 family)